MKSEWQRNGNPWNSQVHWSEHTLRHAQYNWERILKCNLQFQTACAYFLPVHSSIPLLREFVDGSAPYKVKSKQLERRNSHDKY